MRDALLACGLTLAAFFTAPSAHATTDLGCDAGTIKGAYALSATGFQGTAPNFLPVAVVRIAFFDGVSKFRGDGWASVGGDPQRFSSDGTYKVAKNCTVTMDGAITIGTGEPPVRRHRRPWPQDRDDPDRRRAERRADLRAHQVARAAKSTATVTDATASASDLPLNDIAAGIRRRSASRGEPACGAPAPSR